ncbi:MAG TPA: PAS domain S-box protein [Nocardioides sp.]|nr:PAS domain S-box protein [Nocardioides sp.]
MSGVTGGLRPSIVLVDDSMEVRSLVRRRLQSSGFEVVAEGSDGDEAILLAYRHEPNLLLLDTSMPKVDGIEALPAVLALSPATRVVMFTGFDERGLAARAVELGAADFVEKSIRLEDLPDRLMRSLDLVSGATRTGQTPTLDVADDLMVTTRPPYTREQVAFTQEQAVLTEHVQQFRDLFDRAEIGMATLTSSGTIVRANRALAGLMGTTPAELVGVDYGRLTVGGGDDLDRRLEDISLFGEDLTSFEHRVPALPGEEPSRVVRATLAPIRDLERQVLYVFAQVHDVTAQRAMESDLRRSEENFRRLVTAVGEYAIFLLDVDGRVVSWNAGAERIKGYAEHEIVGRSFEVFYPAQDRATGHPSRNLEAALREGSYAEEGWRERKDGSRFWASVVISPVYDDDGRHIGFAKVTRDQTDQREYQEERRKLLEQRVQLLAVTAHELRTPTAVIDGSAGTLIADWEALSAAEREGLLDGIRSSADRLRRLATDLGTASRVYADSLALRFEGVALVDLLQGARSRGLAGGLDVQIDVDVPDDIVVRVDVVRLGQAVDNLLDNAVRHGRPPVRLSGIVDDGDVRIRISDAGDGVPVELVPHLFERFAVAGPTGATGLGLYLVREIARGHGGDAGYHPPADGLAHVFEISLPGTASLNA